VNDWSNQSYIPSQVPAPIPPWARPVQSPMVQTCIGADTIDLGPDVTYLNQVQPSADGNPYPLTLPNGNYLRQMKRILVLGSNIPNTAEFQLFGQFANASSFLFNNAATEAVLEWDSTCWHLIGGSAQPSTTAAT
jgi:hypothetical protein